MLSILSQQFTLLYVLAVVVGLGLLIFFHELGHFIGARLCKVRVEKFAIGFGPEIFGFTKGDTRYSVRWIPLGGMTKMAGEELESKSGAKDEFFSQPWYRRIFIVMAGPIMNYILAVLLFAMVFYFVGVTRASTVIGQTVKNKPAEKVGLKPGDKIVSVAGQKVIYWEDMADIIQKNPNKEIELSADRGNFTITLKIIPEIDNIRSIGVIGIMPDMNRIITDKVGIGKSLSFSVIKVLNISIMTLVSLGNSIIYLEKPEIGGPISVTYFIAKAAKSGFYYLVDMLGLISTALGLFNLLPIPILDGGHIFLFLGEGITRRPLSKKVVQVTNVIGLTIIGVIVVYALYSDILRFPQLLKFW